jgi:hypothetical protein
MSFGLAAFWEVVEELSLAVSVWFGIDVQLKNEWDQADTMFDLLGAVYGVIVAILFIWIVRSPRLIRYPYIDIDRTHNEYGIYIPENTYESDFSWLRIKYWAEIFFIQYVPSRAFLLTTPDLDGTPPIVAFFRLDWLLFGLGQLLTIFIFYYINWWSHVERKVIWKGNLTHYRAFYLMWAISLIILMGPSIYMWTYPKAQVMISLMLMLVLYIPASIYMSWQPLNSKYFKWIK